VSGEQSVHRLDLLGSRLDDLAGQVEGGRVLPGLLVEHHTGAVEMALPSSISSHMSWNAASEAMSTWPPGTLGGYSEWHEQP
jgi:hypothetical protein